MSKKIVEVRFKLRHLNQIQEHKLFVESHKDKYNSINELLANTYISSIQKNNLEDKTDMIADIVREEINKSTSLLLKATKNYTDDLVSYLLSQQIITDQRIKVMQNILAKQLAIDLNTLNNPDSEILQELDYIKEFSQQIKTDYEVWKENRRKERGKK
ncbi:hypothetical protein [Spiroplasma chrysopicola]|uniref:Uncharacterized protein n=1 Tax=Spiroplasma chrysopicola DF-1 TaxID=1276227 RepID=R4U4J9_9MOLU|nr:hypothetical protein [Spiroplasma chrysopicola]AGM25493.1 hypothetical protein SCHRY_v1c09200 [Spiroplasma chrysopicola DF-1]